MDPKTNPPAFPYAFHFPDQDGEPGGINFGMSLRDYFAAKAMTGLIAHGGSSSLTAAPDYRAYACHAYAAADALLAERNAKT